MAHSEIQLENRYDPFIERMICDSLGGCTPVVEKTQCSEQLMRISLSYRLSEEVYQDDWRVQLFPAFRPRFHWAPHLTPTDNHIIDQHCFRSPALIVHDGKRGIALIPDLDIMLKGTSVRWYMDLDAERSMMTLGMSKSTVTDHVLYERAAGAVYPAGEVNVGFYLLLLDEAATADPWRPVLEFLWERWGRPQFKKDSLRAVPPERYVEHAYNWAFKHWRDAVWQEFELTGKTVGAPTFIVDITQSPNYRGYPSEREGRSIWNQAWFSSLRSAQGLYRYGKSIQDGDLLERALKTKELALSAPQTKGIFPSVAATEMETVVVDGQTVHRSQGWDTLFWGNSNRNPLHPWGSFKEAPYHVLDMSWTALLMLRWYDELEPDKRLLEYAAEYAETLIQMQDEQGFFPAWLDIETLEPCGILDQSPETSMSVTFLLKLHELTLAPKYRVSALKAMDAVIGEIIPTGRWEDFETYWSCCSYGRTDLMGRKVKRNDMYKQCNFSMFWTSEALLHCYYETGDKPYLTAGERCLDELLMTQASWQPPFIYVDALGGFGVMNCDGEWNDARQSLFADLILQYGMELDRSEYIERGIAALRASFVMMYCPENEQTKVQWEKAHPFFKKEDYGFMMENYGHEGQTNEEGLGMGTFTIFDWGNGAAAGSYLRIKERYGADWLRRQGKV